MSRRFGLMICVLTFVLAACSRAAAPAPAPGSTEPPAVPLVQRLLFSAGGGYTDGQPTLYLVGKTEYKAFHVTVRKGDQVLAEKDVEAGADGWFRVNGLGRPEGGEVIVTAPDKTELLRLAVPTETRVGMGGVAEFGPKLQKLSPRPTDSTTLWLEGEAQVPGGELKVEVRSAGAAVLTSATVQAETAAPQWGRFQQQVKLSQQLPEGVELWWYDSAGTLLLISKPASGK